MSRTLALGQGTNTIAYAYVGTNSIIYDLSYNWSGATTHLGLSTNTLFSQANAAAWNGYQWIAVGNPVTSSPPGNTMAFSSIYGGNVFFNVTTGRTTGTNSIGNAGSIWTGLGNYIFSTNGNGIGWNGNVWVACGQGGNTLAYSPNGYSWIGLGTNIFSSFGQSVVWNGTYWLAMGNGSVNTMAYSKDGIAWTGLGKGIFSVQANAAVWNGFMWIAVGSGPGTGQGNTIAFSLDTVNWTGLGATIIPTSGTAIAINTARTLLVAAGSNINTTKIVYSNDGISWTACYNNPLDVAYNSVVWNGKFWVVGGNNSTFDQTLAYSGDGNVWVAEGANRISTAVKGVAANMGVGSAIIPTNYTAYTNSNVTDFIFSVPVVNGSFNSDYTATQNMSSILGVAMTGWTNSGSAISAGYASPNNTFGFPTLSGNFCIVQMNTGYTSWTTSQSVYFPTVTSYTLSFSAASRNTLYTSSEQITASVSGISGSVTTNFTAGGQGWTTFTFIFNIPSPGYYTVNFNVTNSGSTDTTIGFTNINITGDLLPTWVAAGQGGNTISYSTNNGQTWNGLGNTVFSVQGNSIAYSPSNLWVATGSGTGNTLAYSTTGISWAGLGKSVFSTSGNYVTWNGVMWVASGSGPGSNQGNTLAYSYDGNTWTGAGTYVFSTSGYGMAWSGQMWISTGQGGNTLAYSYDGINWTGLGTTVFSIAGYTVAWNGIIWLAGGQGTNTLAYSYNGLNWTGLGSGTSSTAVYSIAWNGKIWVAVGQGTNSISWSSNNNGSWTVITSNTSAAGYLTVGYNVTWSGSMWMASGIGTQGNIVYSPNGKLWFATTNRSILTTYAIAFSNYFTNKLVLDNNGVSKTQTLDVVTETFYNQPGYNRLSLSFVTS